MAQLSPSVPQEVKYTLFTSHPKAAATVSRQLSICLFISSPMEYWLLGLPNRFTRTSYMVSATARDMGAVAA